MDKKEVKKRNIRLFIISEFLVISGFGFLFPILAIFIKDSIIGGSVLTAGIAVTIYLLAKALLRIPIGKYCDKKKLYKQFMILGYLMMSLVPIGWFLSTSIYHIFLVELFFAISASIGRCGWYHLFSQNLPKGKEGSSWNKMKGYTGIGDAISATVGGILATFLGFPTTFIIVAILGLIATFILSKVQIS